MLDEKFLEVAVGAYNSVAKDYYLCSEVSIYLIMALLMHLLNDFNARNLRHVRVYNFAGSDSMI